MTLRIERTETLRVVTSEPDAVMTPLHEAVAVVLDAAVAGDPQAQAMINALDDARPGPSIASMAIHDLSTRLVRMEANRDQWAWCCIGFTIIAGICTAALFVSHL